MELRVLRYFLAVAKYGNFSIAATKLNLTQPTLSRQIQELEEELGCQLLLRGKRETILTEAGRYMRGRAQEIIELTEKTRSALGDMHDIGGEVYIAGGETRAMSIVAKAIKKTRERNPGIKFHIFSGNAEAVSERLDNGLADFGIFISPSNLEKYEYINLGITDSWGALLRADHPLAQKPFVEPSDMVDQPLICSRQEMVANVIGGWLGGGFEKLDIVATYTLLYNAAFLVMEGIGTAICLEGIVNASTLNELCFRPLKPSLYAHVLIAWKKDAAFSRAAQKFHQTLQDKI